jgi:hypothetical protein
MKPHLGSLTALLLLALLAGACTPAPAQSKPPPDAIATSLAQRQAAADATEDAIRVILAATAGAPTLMPTTTPTPQPTPTPTVVPSPTLTPTPDYTGRYASARILFYEEWPTYGTKPYQDYESYIGTALDQGGYTYSYHRDRAGYVITGLKNEAWDLVIIANEPRVALNAEVYLALWQHLEKGGAVIWETFALPYLTFSRADQYTAELLWGSCGMKVQGDYPDTKNRQVLLTDPSARLFQVPNPITSLGETTSFWRGDLGELFTKAPGSRAVNLGQISSRENKDIVLFSCLDGRFIFQAFASHDYPRESMVPLWQNYIANALDAHYRYLDAPPDPMQERKASAQVLIFESETKDLQGLKNMGYTQVSAPRTAKEMQTQLLSQTWDVVLYTFRPRQQEHLSLLPLLLAQVEQGARVLVDFAAYGYDGHWKQADPPQAVQAVMTYCGVALTPIQALSTGFPQWTDPKHPLGIWPAANLEPAENFPYYDSYRLFEREPDSQAWFPVTLNGGENPEGRGGLALCRDDNLALQAVPIGSPELFLQNLLDFFLRPTDSGLVQD